MKNEIIPIKMVLKELSSIKEDLTNAADITIVCQKLDTVIKKMQYSDEIRAYGDFVGYFMDLDGNLTPQYKLPITIQHEATNPEQELDALFMRIPQTIRNLMEVYPDAEDYPARIRSTIKDKQIEIDKTIQQSKNFLLIEWATRFSHCDILDTCFRNYLLEQYKMFVPTYIDLDGITYSYEIKQNEFHQMFIEMALIAREYKELKVWLANEALINFNAFATDMNSFFEVTTDVLKHIVTKKELPDGISRINPKDLKAAQAYRFGDKFGMGAKELNAIFKFSPQIKDDKAQLKGYFETLFDKILRKY